MLMGADDCFDLPQGKNKSVCEPKKKKGNGLLSNGQRASSSHSASDSAKIFRFSHTSTRALPEKPGCSKTGGAHLRGRCTNQLYMKRLNNEQLLDSFFK